MAKKGSLGIKKDKEDKGAKYYYNLFQKAYPYSSQRFEDYKELTAFYELCQNELPQYQVEKPWVHNINAPYATDAINLRVASLQSSDYMGELEPLSPDDIESIDKLNWAYKLMWNEIKVDEHVNEAILRSAVMREAYTHIIYEDKPTGGTNRKRKGKLEAYFVDPASIIIDPQARGLHEADFVCVTDRITSKKVRKRYPNFDFRNKENEQSSKYAPQERGEIYLGTDYETEQDFVLTKITFYEKDEDAVYKTVLVEDQIVEETKEMHIRNYPIAQLRWQKKLKSPYGVSLLDMILPLQKTVNEVESAVANTALQFSSPSYVMTAGSGIDPEDLALMGGTPGAVFVVEDGIPIRDVIAPLMGDRKIDKEMIDVKLENERTIYKLAGVSDHFLGSVGTSGNTSGGTDMTIQRAKIIENMFLTNLEEYIKDLTEIIVEYIINVFGGEKLYVRGDKRSDGQFDFAEMEVPENAENIEYTFYIKMDVKTKYSKEQQRQLMKELYEIQTQYDAPVKGITFIDVLKNYDVPNIQELVERLQHMQSMDAEKRAELAVLLVGVASELGIPEEQLKQAMTEIILALKETPTVDMILEQMEQKRAQEEEAQNKIQVATEQFQQEQQLKQMRQMEQQAQQGTGGAPQGQSPQLTGDEVIKMQGGATQLTGDEVIEMGSGQE